LDPFELVNLIGVIASLAWEHHEGSVLDRMNSAFRAPVVSRDDRGRRTLALERLGMMAMFPIGVTPDADGGPVEALGFRPIIAAVTPIDVVFVFADIAGGDVAEAARIRRAEVESVEVVDLHGAPVSEALVNPPDEREPDPEGAFLLRIDMVGPEDNAHQLGFAFPSAVAAGDARDRLRSFVGPDFEGPV
jgi:hypothetical protein